ncbi:MAG: hypothetical protein KBF63_07945 [Rhodoferax sp.]|nr:hypothetical protein [Rhodoferax sp.]
MTKINDNVGSTHSVHPATDTVSPAIAAMARRRRFIRLGASAVPVAMTLASRPVMAWHCNSTSAWGSAQLAGNVGSAKTRLDGTVTRGNECWYINDWKTNVNSNTNMSSAPWEAVKAARNETSVANAQRNLTVGIIFPGGFTAYGATTKVWDIVRNGSGWALSVTVARLNSLYATGGYTTLINNCVASTNNSNGGDQIVRMAKMGPLSYFSPNSPTYKWKESDITGYLSSNWLAV